MVQALLAKGGDVDAKENGKGITALTVASMMATLTWCRRCSPRGSR